MKTSLYKQLTTISRSKVKSEIPIYQMRRGIEAKLPYHPFLEDWGDRYQSILRTGLNDMQGGMSEDEIEKTYQKRFNLDWAWADSIATQIKQTFDQLTTAKENQIDQLKEDLESGYKKVKDSIQKLEEKLTNSTASGLKGFDNKLLGLRSKLARLQRQSNKLNKLISSKRLHICFGSKKLFNAQHHLKENGYANHAEWLEDWRKSRGGNFYAVGKGSADGNNPVCPIRHIEDDIFSVTIHPPRFLRCDYAEDIELEFEVTGQRKHDLLYALESNKPVTVQIFRREDKDDAWYIHLCTYVQTVPTISNKKNGCIGIDLNAESIDVIYIKCDGNPLSQDGRFVLFSFPLPTGTTGQKQAELRDIVADIVRIAECYECPIAVENLDFSKKKSQLRHSGSRRYNRMLSGFVYDKFRACLMVRAEKRGIEVKFINPAFTSIIGMVKYMPRYGLNSGSAAAMVIARRALGYKEIMPQAWLNALSRPVDQDRASWSGWKVLASALRKYSITRHLLFRGTNVLEVIQSSSKRKPKGKPGATSLSVDPEAKLRDKSESPMPTDIDTSRDFVQLCLGI